MVKRTRKLLCFTALAAALSLAACNRGPNDAELAKLDNQIAGNDADPALTSALEDQILVDPSLAQQSNNNAVRPPESPTQGQYPAPQGGGQRPAPKQQQAARPGTPAPSEGNAAMANLRDDVAAGRGTACGAEFDHNLGWARRLPRAFAVYPGARVTEAAGNDTGDCRVRVVTFTSDAAPQRVLDWYSNSAGRAGYSSEHQRREADHILAGVNQGDGGAFYLIVTPRPRGGSDVALIANNGG